MKFLKKLLSLVTAASLILPSIILPNLAQAATSFDVYNLPTLYLNIGINTTTVNGITLGAPYLNGTAVAIPAMSGAIFQFTQNGKRENIYAGRVAVDSTTKIITLSGVVRDLCYNQTRTFTSCNTGQLFSKGTQVVLTDDARLFNLKANTDRANTFTGSGSVQFSGSGSLSFPTFATTTARNQQLGTNPGGPVRIACSTADGLCYYYIGGSWNSFGTSGVGNASESAAGKVQLGTVKDQTGATVTGSTGAPTVVQTQYLTGSGGLSQRGKIPFLGRNGFMSGSLLGSGSPSSTTVLFGNNTWAGLTNTAFGTGTGGAITWSANTSLNPLNQFNYTTSTLNSSVTLNVSTSNKILRLRSTGNVTINGTIDLDGSGGIAGVKSGFGLGGTGQSGSGWLSSIATLGGGGGNTSGGIGGGGGSGASGTEPGLIAGGSSGTKGIAGVQVSAWYFAFLNSLAGQSVMCGAGGGAGGGDGVDDSGGNGGRGGGCMTWYIGGNLTLGASSIIRARGKDGVIGTTAGAGGGGGGGGGGAGMVLIIVSGVINNAGVTLQATGGAAGGATNGNGGGTGANGRIFIYSLSTGQLIQG